MNPTEDDERAGLPSASFSLKYKCLGAWNLIQACKKAKLITDDGGAAAESGTEIHQARAGEDIELTDSQEDMRQTLTRIELSTVETLYPGLGLHGREQRMWLRRGLRLVFSGKYDCAYADMRFQCVALFDDKTGRLEVDAAERNLQMRDMAALWGYHHPETQQLDVIVIQPLITHEPSIARYSKEELYSALTLLNENLLKIAKPDAPRTPGHHCLHCPARAHCDEAKNYSIQGPRVLLDAIERGDIILPLGVKGKAVLESIDAGYAILNKLWECYEIAIKADPESVPGWHLAEGSERREITDYKAAKELLANVLPEEEIDQATTFKITELEKLFCNRSGTIQVKAKAKFNALLEPVIKLRRSKASLKPVAQRGKRARKPAEPKEELAL